MTRPVTRVLSTLAPICSFHFVKFILLLSAAFLLSRRTQAQTNTFPATGNAGIGTLSPAYPLDVIGSARISGPLYVNGGTDQSMTATTNGNWDFLNGSGGGWYFRWIQNGATPMTLSTSNNPAPWNDHGRRI